jgi:DNA polymerase bacteriophage-type
MRLHLDYETKSELDLKEVGIFLYANHPSTRVIMASWSFNYGPVKQWDSESGEPIPQELLDAIENDEIEKWAFNAAFERMISKHVLKLKTNIRSWFCTMVLAYSQSFMGTLEMISKQMGNSEDKQKSKDGKRLIRLFCGPQKPTAKNPWVWRDGMTDPEDWYSFLAYNKQDVVTERDGLYKKLIKYPMPPEEWELYHIDQEINDRGIPIDRTFVANAITLCDRVKAEMFELMVELTGLSNPNSPTQLLGWIQERGYPFSDLRKETVEKVLRENEEGSVTYNYETKRLEPDPQMLTDDCVKALKMRQASARTSVMKYNAIVQRLSSDDRIHHAFQFGGASRTQRWAGRGVQVHNLPRTPKYLEPEDIYAERLEDVTEIIRQNDYGMLKLYVSDPLDALAGTVRSSIQAPEGMELRVCDLSSIENVSLGALADCQRILNIFREGRDPYKDFGTDFYNVPYEEVTKLQRTNSKPAVLGAGYRLGGGEMRDGKKTGLWGYAENMKVFLSQEEAGASVRIWRENHPEVVNYWYALENAIEKTVTRGTKNKVGMVEFFYNKPYLCCRLPSGRVMYYYKPMVHYEDRQSRNGSTYRKAVISYMGKNQITTQWERIESHGGKFTENIVQAFARDVLATGMRRAHEDGFYIVLHVHDELGALQRRGDNYFTYQRLGDLMTQEIPWCPGLPLGYGGYGADFYRKD